MQYIHSVQNPRIKAAVRLRTHKERQATGRFLIDGLRELRGALAAQVPIVEVYKCVGMEPSTTIDEMTPQLLERGAEVILVSRAVIERLGFGDRNEGMVAVAANPGRSLRELKLPDPALVIVLEKLEKPGNIGAVLRTAAAAGVSAVLVAQDHADLYNPNTIRASMGAIFSLPVYQAPVDDVAQYLTAHDPPLRIIAARVDAPTDHWDLCWTGNIAIVLGSEARGLSPRWRASQRPDVQDVRIPMSGDVDSLNVSVTAAILLYEAVGQRRHDRVRNSESASPTAG